MYRTLRSVRAPAEICRFISALGSRADAFTSFGVQWLETVAPVKVGLIAAVLPGPIAQAPLGMLQYSGETSSD
jgi:hypothetical protein